MEIPIASSSILQVVAKITKAPGKVHILLLDRTKKCTLEAQGAHADTYKNSGRKVVTLHNAIADPDLPRVRRLHGKSCKTSLTAVRPGPTRLIISC